MMVWGAVLFGQQRIVHSVNKDLKDLTGSLVVIDVPNISCHETLFVVTKGSTQVLSCIGLLMRGQEKIALLSVEL